MDGRAQFLAAIDFEVRAAYLSEAEIRQELGDLAEVLDLELTPELRADASEHLRRSLATQRDREATWAARTVNDRITAAFAALGAEGILALEDAGYTQSEGWEAVRVAAEGREARGAAFFHRQDVESALDGGLLRITFGAFESGDGHAAASEAIARRVCDVLREQGVETTWDGTVATRIRVAPFEWQRRRFTKDPGDGPVRKPWWKVW